MRKRAKYVFYMCRDLTQWRKYFDGAFGYQCSDWCCLHTELHNRPQKAEVRCLSNWAFVVHSTEGTKFCHLMVIPHKVRPRNLECTQPRCNLWDHQNPLTSRKEEVRINKENVSGAWKWSESQKNKRGEANGGKLNPSFLSSPSLNLVLEYFLFSFCWNITDNWLDRSEVEHLNIKSKSHSRVVKDFLCYLTA